MHSVLNLSDFLCVRHIFSLRKERDMPEQQAKPKKLTRVQQLMRLH